MRSKAVSIALYVIGLLLCVVPPCLAVLDRFAFWVPAQRVSAYVILLLCVCCIPIWKQVRNGIRSFAENPSAWEFWLAMTVVLRLFDAISSDMLVICRIALPCSIAGAFLMAYARKKMKGDE